MRVETKGSLMLKIAVMWVVIGIFCRVLGASTNASTAIAGLIVGACLVRLVRCPNPVNWIYQIASVGVFYASPLLWGAGWVWVNDFQYVGMAASVDLLITMAFLLVYPRAQLA